ncbi:hypothetical protein [Amycolatopsis lexingtonensis]|uniref:hypothetical protein n=1 Tax=Amycolatopsis lexingtonensis TaxID=218822 RepID=UPI003F702ED2
MPKTQNTRSNDTQPETAETKVRRTLAANPGATAATLASAAGVGRSTATKILSRWAADGLVARTAGKDQSVPVTWTLSDEQNDDAAEVALTTDDLTTGDQEAEAPVGDVDEQDAVSSSVPDREVSSVPGQAMSGVPTPEAPKKERLPKGGLYALVKEFLQAHPGDEFGPAKIGTELGRSSGAVNNALERLVINGLAAKTCEAPKRFSSC